MATRATYTSNVATKGLLATAYVGEGPVWLRVDRGLSSKRPGGDLHVERGDPGSPAAVTGRYHSVRLCIPVIQCRTGAAVMVPS